MSVESTENFYYILGKKFIKSESRKTTGKDVLNNFSLANLEKFFYSKLKDSNNKRAFFKPGTMTEMSLEEQKAIMTDYLKNKFSFFSLPAMEKIIVANIEDAKKIIKCNIPSSNWGDAYSNGGVQYSIPIYKVKLKNNAIKLVEKLETFMTEENGSRNEK